MNKELYVIATPNLMRECFREFEPLFEKISRINCYGILRNGLTLRFTGDTTGLRYFKSYSEVKEMLCEMAIRDLQQELERYKNIVDELEKYLNEIPNNNADGFQYGRESLAEDLKDLIKKLKGE